MRRLGSAWLVGVAVLVIGCASGGGGGRPASGSSSRFIATPEVRQASVRNAFELVQLRRPQWLRTRGPASIRTEGFIVVYLDNTRLGDPETMRDVPIEEIASMRFMDATEATGRYGTGHTHGAIVITRLSAQAMSPAPR